MFSKISNVARKKILKKLKNKYRLIIYNDSTFAEVFSLKLSKLNIYSILGTTAILLIVLGSVLVLYSPVKRLLPSSEYQVKRILYQNIEKMDSLEHLISNNQAIFSNISLILQGKDSLLIKDTDTIVQPKTAKNNNKFTPLQDNNNEDAILRATIEQEEKFNITKGEKSNKESTNLKNLYLPPPLNNGIIIAEYENTSGGTNPHLGIDISGKKNSHIMTVMPGTVISANWSIETGYSIIIQHEKGFISCYKHCSELLKTIGETVRQGEVIGIIGNTGEETTGPHLHFELWYKGTSLNPKDYIVF